MSNNKKIIEFFYFEVLNIIILIIFLFTTLPYMLIDKYVSKKYKHVILPATMVITFLLPFYLISKIFFTLVLFISSFFFIPFHYKGNFNEYEINDYDKKQKHVWVTNYYKNNFVYKELNKIYMGHNDYSHLKIPFINGNYNKYKYNLVIYFIHTHIALYYQKLSNYRKKKYFNDSRFFPKIIDYKNNYDLIVCERIEKELYNLSKQDINFNINDELFLLDKELCKHGFYLDDMHLKNFMLDKNNQLKIIDGELYTPLEHRLLKLFIQTFDSQVSSILPIFNTNIYEWRSSTNPDTCSRGSIRDLC